MTSSFAPTTNAARPSTRSALLGLLFLNIILAAMLVTVRALWSRWLIVGGVVHINLNVIIQGQIIAGALAAAIVPRRSFLGLAWVSGIGLIWGLIAWVPILINQKEPLAFASIALSPLFYALGALMIAQGLRFILRWRIASADEQAYPKPLPLSIGDLLEWTLSIACWLAFVKLAGSPLEDLRTLLEIIASEVLIAAPMAFTVISQRGLTIARTAMIVLWAITVRLFIYGVYAWIDPTVFTNRPWWYFAANEVQEIAGILLVTGSNFAALRCLGYRWQRPRGSKVSPAGA